VREITSFQVISKPWNNIVKNIPKKAKLWKPFDQPNTTYPQSAVRHYKLIAEREALCPEEIQNCALEYDAQRSEDQTREKSNGDEPAIPFQVGRHRRKSQKHENGGLAALRQQLHKVFDGSGRLVCYIPFDVLFHNNSGCADSEVGV
jgi:hypothetical protein